MRRRGGGGGGCWVGGGGAAVSRAETSIRPAARRSDEAAAFSHRMGRPGCRALQTSLPLLRGGSENHPKVGRVCRPQTGAKSARAARNAVP